jgi:hypothetical protein
MEDSRAEDTLVADLLSENRHAVDFTTTEDTIVENFTVEDIAMEASLM